MNHDAICHLCEAFSSHSHKEVLETRLQVRDALRSEATVTGGDI